MHARQVTVGKQEKSYSETRPLGFCDNRGLCRCRRTPQPIAYDSAGAELRSLRQRPWRLRVWQHTQLKVNMQCLEPRLPSSHTDTQGHTTRSPSEPSFNLGLIHDCCTLRTVLLLSNPSGAPRVGSRCRVRRKFRLSHTDESSDWHHLVTHCCFRDQSMSC